MKTGLVLSGGAAYGLANAGVLDVLEEHDIKPDCIAGSSMGAIVGALYALTGNASLLHPLTDALNLSNIARPSAEPFKGGLHGGMLRQELHRHIASLIGDARIGDCMIPFTCVAGRVKEPIVWTHIIRPGFTDEVLRKVEMHVFPDETRLLDALMATSAIPVVFSPVTIGGDTFVDLVHFGAVPARTLKERHHPDILIATDTVPTYDTLKHLLPAAWKEFLDRGYAELERSKSVCDRVITPRMPAALFRFDKAASFVQAGREATEAALPAIRALIR